MSFRVALQDTDLASQGHTLHVSTSDKALQHQLESYVDGEGVSKFELTDQEYGARRGEPHCAVSCSQLRLNADYTDVSLSLSADTVRAYKQRMGIGRFAHDADQPKPHEPLPDHIHTGDRCEGGSGRRGTVGYVGYVSELPSHKDLVPVWVGVQWDEPVPASTSGPVGAALSIPASQAGKSDGCVKGKRYFDCPEGFGSFVRPDRIEIGQQFAKEAWEDELEDL